MRLLLIAYHYPPVNNGGVERPAKFVRYLPDHGVEVTVLTHTSGPSDLTSEAGVLRAHDHCREGSARVRWAIGRGVERIVKVAGRHLDPYRAWRCACVAMADAIRDRARPDAILCSYPPIEALEVGLALATRYSVPLILDFRDGLLFESLEPHLLARPGTRARRAAIEATAVERAAAVVTVSEPISRYFRSRYGHGEVVTITNGFDPADLPADEEPAPAPGPPVRIVYTGRLSLSDMGCDVRPFLRGAVDALAARGDDRLRLRFVGQFTREETVAMQPLRDRGVLVVEPLVDRVTALSAQRQADALLLVTGTDRTSVLTGKIFEYLAAGRPIVAVASGTAAGDLVAELGAGWVVSPHDADGISRLIGCLLDDPAVLTAAQPAREAVNRFSRPALAGALAQVLARAARRSTERSRPE